MSGLEVIGAISAVIAILDSSIKVYDSAQKDLKLSETFKTVRSRLPVLLETLKTCASALQAVEDFLPVDVCEALETILTRCDDTAGKLRQIFEKVLPGKADTRQERYVKIVRRLGKGNKVEELMVCITEDIQLVVNHHAVKSAGPEQKSALEDIIKEMKSVQSSLPEEEDRGMTFNSQGGAQTNFTSGSGRQINNTGVYNEVLSFRHQQYFTSEPMTISTLPDYKQDSRIPPSRTRDSLAPGTASPAYVSVDESTERSRRLSDSTTCFLTGSLSNVHQMLETDFDVVAVGEWFWLKELADLGYSRMKIASLILERREQSPWIFFEPWITTHSTPDQDYHVHNCVHTTFTEFKNPDIYSNTSSSPSAIDVPDLRRTVASLCGLGGIAPDSPDTHEWNGTVEFPHENEATICYRGVDVRPAAVLVRTKRAVEKLCTAIALNQKAKGCCNSFTVPFLKPEQSIVELQVVSSRDVKQLCNELQKATADDLVSLQHCKKAAIATLPWLQPLDRFLKPSSPTSDKTLACLHTSALAVQTLCLSFTLYSQAHCSPLDLFFLENELTKFNLLGILASTEEGPYVRAETKRLTCLDSMLKAPVVVYSLSTDQGSSSDRVDVLTSAIDMLDTWGPGVILWRPIKDRVDSIMSVNLRGGKVFVSGHKRHHWSRFEELQDGWWNSDWTVSDHILIGASVDGNPVCQTDERKCLRVFEEFWNPLGTYRARWDVRHKELSVQAGQYVIPVYNVVLDKVPGVLLKTHLLTYLADQRELLAFLNAPCGLQISFCSGLAKRVRMKDLLAELMPLCVKRDQSGTHCWKKLTDEYRVTEHLMGADLKSCQNMFERMRNQDPDCHEWFWSLTLHITTFLKDTGLDPTGDDFVVGFVPSDASEPLRRLSFKSTDSSFWLRALQDTEACATFAFFTLSCLQIGGLGCCRRKRWHGRVLLLQTEVHRQFRRITGPRPVEEMTLEHGKLYPLGGKDAERRVRLCVRVHRPSPSVYPQLLVRQSKLTPGMWKRMIIQHDHFLQEQLGQSNPANRAFLTGTELDTFSFSSK
jgi:hypothetical protein